MLLGELSYRWVCWWLVVFSPHWHAFPSLRIRLTFPRRKTLAFLSACDVGNSAQTAFLVRHCLENARVGSCKISSSKTSLPVLAGNLSLWLEAFQEGCDSNCLPLIIRYFAFGSIVRTISCIMWFTCQYHRYIDKKFECLVGTILVGIILVESSSCKVFIAGASSVHASWPSSLVINVPKKPSSGGLSWLRLVIIFISGGTSSRGTSGVFHCWA